MTSSREIDAQIRTLQHEEDADQGPRHRRSRDERRSEAPMAFILYRGEYDQRTRSGEGRHARGAAAAARPICRTIGSASPSGCCGPSIR